MTRIERGQLDRITLERLRRVLTALGGRLDVVARWSGGDVDRLLGARHSAMHELMAARFAGLPGWEIAPEVSFSIYGERGVIDILAWHEASGTLLIIELKTEIVDINELMGKADQRRRLASTIAAERGWRPRTVAVWIVVADSRTNRRRLAEHRTVLRAAFPMDGRSIGTWLTRPSGPMACLSFLSNRHETRPGSSLAAPGRVHPPRSRTASRPGS